MTTQELANKIGLRKEQLEEIRSLLSDFPNIKEAIVYGSRAKGNFRKFSDIDLTLKGRDLNFSDVASLEDRLYHTYLPYLFDISIFAKLSNPALIDHINRRGITIYPGI